METESSTSDRKALIKFLMDYTIAFMRSGAQSSRIMRNIERLSNTWGYKSDTIILPKTIIMTLSDKSENTTTLVRKIPEFNLNFRVLSALRKLSWDTYLQNLSFEECKRRFSAIKEIKPLAFGTVLFWASAGNAAFCYLLGGHCGVAFVFLATLAGFLLKEILTRMKINALIKYILCAAATSLICAKTEALMGYTDEISVYTSILFLIPGIPLLNSVIDIIDGHILSGIYRFTNAIMLVFAMTVGLLTTLFILGGKIQ